MIHQLVEGGRILLVALAVVALRGRRTADARDQALWATAAGVLALPLMFPAPLPRYMLPGLPLLCALAAVRPVAHRAARRARGWARPSPWRRSPAGSGRAGTPTAGTTSTATCAIARSCARKQAVVRAVAAERPRAVAAAFPLYFAFADAGVPVVLAGAATPTPALCARRPLRRRRAVGARRRRARRACTSLPWRTFGAPGLSVTVSRIELRCLARHLVRRQRPRRREIERAQRRRRPWGSRARDRPAPSRIAGGSPTLSRPKTSTVSSREGGVPVRARRRRREEPRLAERRQRARERLPRGPGVQLHARPVVEAGALDVLVIEGEAERLDEVQRGADGERGAAEVARVPVDLGLDEDEVEHAPL